MFQELIKSLRLKISDEALRDLLSLHENQGMFYSVKTKPESLLYYPILKSILHQGWQGVTINEFKEIILEDLKYRQLDFAKETTPLKPDTVGTDGKISNQKSLETESDLPFAAKGQRTIDSHRPLDFGEEETTSWRDVRPPTIPI